MLPLSRNRTYTGANSIVPGDLDDMQDCIVGRKHGPISLSFTPVLVKPGSWTQFGPFVQSVAGGQTGMIAFPAQLQQAGNRLLQIDLMANGDGAVDCTHVLNRYVAATMLSGAAIANPTDSNRAAAWGVLNVFTGLLPINAGDTIALEPTPNAALYKIGTITVMFDRP